MYYHEVIREKKGTWYYHEVAGSLSLSLSARQEFILCPTDSTFISLTLTMQIELHERSTSFSRALKPGRREWIASLRRLAREILSSFFSFFPSREQRFI